jgi:hypothetical protein
MPKSITLGIALVAIAGDEHVRRSEVAVQHAPAMRTFDRLARLHEQPQSFVKRQLPTFAVRGDRQAVDEFHRQERATQRVGAGVVDRGDVRMTPREHQPTFGRRD